MFRDVLFITPRDGDFLSARIGDSAPLYVDADNEITEKGFVSGEIPLGTSSAFSRLQTE